MKGARATARAVPRRNGVARFTLGVRRRPCRAEVEPVGVVEESPCLNPGDLAERMLPIAAALSCITHGDGGAVDVEWVLGRLAPDEWPALVTVLAGMVDPDAKLVDVFGYITWDENERPLAEMPFMAGTVRDLEAKWHTPAGVEELLRHEGFTKKYRPGGGQSWVKERAA